MDTHIGNGLRDLAELRFLSGVVESADQFYKLYARMLTGCLVQKDQTLARAMKKVLLEQAQFLIFELLKENSKHEAENVQ